MNAAELYLSYSKDVRALARKLTRTREEAEELVSATFEVLPKALQRYRGEAQPRTFVLGICTNLSRHLQRSAMRRKRAHESLAGEPVALEAPDPETLAIRRELAEAVLQAVEALPEEQRTAFLLAGVEERSASEVAALVGVPEATVRSRLFHARRKLQEALALRKRGLRTAMVLMLALLVASSGFAAYRQREQLGQAMKRAVEALAPLWRRPRAAAPVPAAPRAQAPAEAPGEARVAEVLTAPPLPLMPEDVLLPASPSAPPPPTAQVRAPARRVRPPAPEQPGPSALFARAQALHFNEHRYAEAVAAWEAYLAAAPQGTFAPEARYNLGVALLRLGALPGARQALAPFAAGELGGYRQEDARALIEEIDRREQP